MPSADETKEIGSSRGAVPAVHWHAARQIQCHARKGEGRTWDLGEICHGLLTVLVGLHSVATATFVGTAGFMNLMGVARLAVLSESVPLTAPY